MVACLGGCAALPSSGQHLFSPSAVQYTGETASSRAMYNYLLGQIAGVHASLAEQEQDQANAKEYLQIAVPHLLEAAAAIDDAELAEHATKAAIYAGEQRQAITAAQRWAVLQPEESRAHQYAALAALSLGEQELASTHLAHVVELAPNIDNGLLSAGALLKREQNAEHALAASAQLMRMYPESAMALYVHGSVQQRFEQQDAALQTLDQALQLQADSRLALLLKAKILQDLQRTDEALALLRAEIETHPDNIEVRTAYARMLIGQRRFAEAREQYEILLQSQPDNIDLLYRLGMLTLELNQLAQADQYFQQVLRSGQRSFATLFQLGRLAEMQEAYQKALQYYLRVTEGEYRLEALLREARMLSRLGKPEQGLAVIERLQAANNDPALDVRLYLSQIDIWVAQKDYQAAYTAASEGLRKHNHDPDLLFTRSMLSEELGNTDEAIADLEYLLEQEPENPDLLNALGYTLANHTREYPRARGLLEQAMRLKPDNAAITDSMGWVLYKQGQLAEAETYIHKAYTLDPDPEIAAHYGEILWQQGQHQQARAIWERALQTHPEHDVLNETLDRLDSARQGSAE